MPKITYVAPDLSQQTLDLPVGTTVMRGAVDNDVDGIIGQCGGYAQCGTCHVFIEADSVDQLRPIEPDEDDMLDLTACTRRPNSRLGCQLEVTEALDGLVVHLPERQA
jgi:ferredoxin, 2Fe-2S